jgi:hypothetical protein
MESKVFADKGWQYVGVVPAAGHLYADGTWCYDTNEDGGPAVRARTCDAKGDGVVGNYYKRSVSGNTLYPYSGSGAVLGQLVFRVGKQGSPEALDMRGEFNGGEELWMTMNEQGTNPRSGYMTLRFASAADSAAYDSRMQPTNSYGDPIGTQYTRNAAGGYDKKT